MYTDFYPVELLAESFAAIFVGEKILPGILSVCLAVPDKCRLTESA
jgi:hypothetical protein